MNIGFVGAAGEVKRDAAAPQVFQHAARAEQQKMIGFQFAPAQALQAVRDSAVQSAQIFIFIPERLACPPAAFLDALRELHHLIDRLLAVLAHDVVVEHLPRSRFSFVRPAGQHFQEHRDHHVRPPLADQGKRAVKIEQDMTDAGAGSEAGAEFDRTFEGGSRKHFLVSRIGFS